MSRLLHNVAPSRDIVIIIFRYLRKNGLLSSSRVCLWRLCKENDPGFVRVYNDGVEVL